MNPMLKRRLHFTTFFVLIPLALAVTICWVLSRLYRLLPSWTSLVTAVTNGLRSWTLTDSDSHHHMTSMTLAPHQPTLNTATTALHHWSFTECGIGMILLVIILVCVSITASRSLGKIPIDVTHIYTWKLSQYHNKTDDSAPAPLSPMPPSSSITEIATVETTSPSLQPLELSSGTPSHDEKQSPTPLSVVEMPAGTACHSPAISTSTTIMPTTKTENDLSDSAQMEMTQQTGTAAKSTTTTTTAAIATTNSIEKTATAIDKRRKKRNKQGKKKDRGKRVSVTEQHSNEQQLHQVLRTKPGDSTTQQSQTQKMSVKSSPQSTILVPPSPPRPPCDDQHRSSTSPVTPTPPAHGVTQELFPVKPAVSTTSSRSPPSPTVSPNDHHPSIISAKKRSTMTESPPLTPTPQQPMVTKFISNKKDTSPPTSTSQIPPPSSTKAFTSFSSTPSPPSTSLHTTAGISGRQSWYSPFNTGLEFDLLSRSPPSPTYTNISASSSSSPSLSVSSSTLKQNNYRLFSDPPSSRPPPPSTIPPSIGGYSNHQQLQQQPHQLHQYQPHSQPHSHPSLQLQHYQHRHPHHTYPTQQQHHPFQQQQQPPQLYHSLGGGGNAYDHLIYGSLPTPTPPLSATQKATTMKPPSSIYLESSSSIADLPPPPTSARLPTPPVSLSPVIAPPTLPPPPPPPLPPPLHHPPHPSSFSASSTSSSLSSTGEPASSSSSASKLPTGTFPFSSWYPWKPRSDSASNLSPTLYHQQQQYHQESACHGNTDDINEHQPPQSFSLFDRKLPFHASGGGGRFHGASSSQR